MDSTVSPDNKPIMPHKIRIIVLSLIVVGFFLTLLIFSVLSRLKQHKELLVSSKPTMQIVYTTKPSFSHKVPSLVIPGEVHPYLSTNVYSRISGTLKARYVDIGSVVHSGQLLGLVDAPEMDQDLAAARAQLAQTIQNMNQAKYNYTFAVTSYKRWKITGKGGAIAQQDIDQRQNQYDTAYAAYLASMDAVKTAQANVKRNLDLQAYKRITAPFSGIISQRNVDPGANIVSGGSSTSTNLFMIQQIDKIRIYANAPQTFLPYVKPQMPLKITIPEYPNLSIPGKVFSTSSMLDANTRTMLLQIIVKNSTHKLYPGLYVNVALNADKKFPIMTVADNTIMSTSKGLKVLSLKNNRVHYIFIHPGRNYGSEVEIKSGLKGDETLVENPTDSLKEGQKVKAVALKPED